MGFAKIYPNESPRVQAVKRDIGAYKPGTRTLAVPRMFSRSEGGQLRPPPKKLGLYTPPSGWGGYQRAQQTTESPSSTRHTAGVGTKRRTKPASAPKSSKNTKTFRKKQPTILDDILGCDELGCMLDDCSLEDVFDELGNFGDDLLKFGKKVVGAVVDAFDTVMGNPVFKAVFPVIALANSDVGLKIGSAVPGVGNVVALGSQVREWAKSSNIALPPNVASWATSAASGITKEIPPEVTAWAKAAIPQEAIDAAKKAGVDISSLKRAPSTGTQLGDAVRKGTSILSAFGGAIKEGVTNAYAAAGITPPADDAVFVSPDRASPLVVKDVVMKPTVAVSPALALAAPVPMTAVPASQPQPTVNYTVSPLSGAMASVVAQFEKQIGGDLARIQAQVKLRSLQDQATSEHKALMKQARFERNIVSGLKQIAANTKR